MSINTKLSSAQPPAHITQTAITYVHTLRRCVVVFLEWMPLAKARTFDYYNMIVKSGWSCDTAAFVRQTRMSEKCWDTKKKTNNKACPKEPDGTAHCAHPVCMLWHCCTLASMLASLCAEMLWSYIYIIILDMCMRAVGGKRAPYSR